MMNAFANVPMDDDTYILDEREVWVGRFNALQISGVRAQLFLILAKSVLRAYFSYNLSFANS